VAAVFSTALVIFGLYWARDVIIPIVFAMLLALLLLPIVGRVERLGLGRTLAVLLVSAWVSAGIVVVGWVAAVQVMGVLEKLPAYEQTIRGKVSKLEDAVNQRSDRLTRMFRHTGPDETAGPLPVLRTRDPDAPDTVSIDPPGAPPTPVRVVDAGEAPLTMARRVAIPILRPLVMAGLAAVLAVFLLLRWEDLNDRVVRLISRNRLVITANALSELSGSIAKVLRLQMIVNLGFGMVAGAMLWSLGTPNALLWGLLATVLRFIPYVGPVIAAFIPALLALASTDAWTMPLTILGGFLVLEAITGNFVEPMVFAASAGVSTVALLVSAAFWTWLWGPAGLILSTPITVGLAVVGRHFPALQLLDILLSDTPVLTPATRLYQRLVTNETGEAARLAKAHHEANDLEGLFEDVLLPLLRQVESDRQHDLLDEERACALIEVLGNLVAEAAEREGISMPDASSVGGAPVICLPAHDEADQVSAAMLAIFLTKSGRPSRALSLDELGGDVGKIVTEAQPKVICLCAVPPFGARRIRLRRRQLDARTSGFPTIAALWVGRRAEHMRPDDDQEEAASRRSGSFAVTLVQARDQVAAYVPPVAQIVPLVGQEQVSPPTVRPGLASA
jgi:predicted PurR-regulated permease PerM